MKSYVMEGVLVAASVQLWDQKGTDVLIIARDIGHRIWRVIRLSGGEMFR